jgi:hybrid cluster-associated redox disulfide protein
MIELIVTERRFEPGMTVGEALALHPNARWVFASFHLGGCTHCAISTEETLAKVAEGYGLPLDRLIVALNSLLATPA